MYNTQMYNIHMYNTHTYGSLSPLLSRCEVLCITIKAVMTSASVLVTDFK